MSNIIPIKIEYNFKIKEHKLRASTEHLENSRKVSFYFDNKLVASENLPAGDFLTDDDIIRNLVENYCKNKTGVYADLFKNHSDKVHLVNKTLEFVIENYGMQMNALVTVEKEKYFVEVRGNHGSDIFSGTFESENFSEVLEKVRIFTATLTEISDKFSTHINELSNDKVEEWIKWD